VEDPADFHLLEGSKSGKKGFKNADAREKKGTRSLFKKGKKSSEYRSDVAGKRGGKSEGPSYKKKKRRKRSSSPLLWGKKAAARERPARGGREKRKEKENYFLLPEGKGKVICLTLADKRREAEGRKSAGERGGGASHRQTGDKEKRIDRTLKILLWADVRKGTEKR